MSQHTAFPDYFRLLFYETGNLFPGYAPHVGAGQNIYHFSYYGLLSPVTLLSYCFPSVEMPVFISAASAISLAAGCLLFYWWLSGKGLSNMICITVSCVFLLSGPMLYHSFKHVMFVNYMPFLCLALIGTDRLHRNGKAGLLTAGVFLMILSSYYFSVGGIVSILLYGISLRLDGRICPDARGSLVFFLLPVVTAVLMSGILLVPTFCALLEGPRGGQGTANVFSLLIPEFVMKKFLYSPYGFGLSAILLTALPAGLLLRKRGQRFLSASLILISVFPVFLYILNGGLYPSEKGLIPFLPLVCYLIALFIRNMEMNENQFQIKVLLLFAFSMLVIFLAKNQSHYWTAAFADALLMLLCAYTLIRLKKANYLAVPAVILLLASCLYVQGLEKNIDRKTYERIMNPAVAEAVEAIGLSDQGFYRFDTLQDKVQTMNRVCHGNQYLTSVYSSSSHEGYAHFRNDIFQLERPLRNDLMQAASQNPLFLTFMGVKYVRADSAPAGYELFLEAEGAKIYRNSNVLPLGYVTAKVAAEKDLLNAEFPYRQELLLNRAVVGAGYSGINQGPDFQSRMIPLALRLPEIESDDGSVVWDQSVYRVDAQKNVTGSILLEEPASEDLLIFLEMNLINHTPRRDISIIVRNQRNRLSAENYTYYNGNTVFRFAVTVPKGSRDLPVNFSAGNYEISSLRSYSLKASDMTREDIASSSFEPTKSGAKGNVISGTVNTGEDGYFVTSIPYDEHFRVELDGKEISYERVNTAFLGFPVSRGFHQIEICYLAPGIRAGAACSIFGFLAFTAIIARLRKIDEFANSGKIKMGNPKKLKQGIRKN